MKTADGVTFHGQTLFYAWCEVETGKLHLETCHWPIIDTQHRIWSLDPRNGAKVSYGTLDDHYSSLDAVSRMAVHLLEVRKRTLDDQIAKWKSICKDQRVTVPPGFIAYWCDHDPMHSGFLSLDPYEVAFRKWLVDAAWLPPGGKFCYLHLPASARQIWVDKYAPTIAEGI